METGTAVRLTPVQLERLRRALAEEESEAAGVEASRRYEESGRLRGQVSEFGMAAKSFERMAAAGLIERRPAFDRDRAARDARDAAALIMADVGVGDWRAARSRVWDLQNAINRVQAVAWFLTERGREEARR